MRLLCYSSLLFFALSLRAEAEAPESAEVETAKAPRLRRDADECITDPMAIEDMRARREELENKERDLSSREGEISAKQRALDEELKRLEEIRDQIAKIEDAQRVGNEEKVTKVVETVEGMSPKTAAAMFAELDDGVAVVSMMRMSSQKLSKIMNQLPATRSSRLTELLAGVARARRAGKPTALDTSTDVAEAQKRKGGENIP